MRMSLRRSWIDWLGLAWLGWTWEMTRVGRLPELGDGGQSVRRGEQLAEVGRDEHASEQTVGVEE